MASRQLLRAVSTSSAWALSLCFTSSNCSKAFILGAIRSSSWERSSIVAFISNSHRALAVGSRIRSSSSNSEKSNCTKPDLACCLTSDIGSSFSSTLSMSISVPSTLKMPLSLLFLAAISAFLPDKIGSMRPSSSAASKTSSKAVLSDSLRDWTAAKALFEEARASSASRALILLAFISESSISNLFFKSAC